MYSFSYPAVEFGEVPSVDASTMQHIDEAMLSISPITLYQMMERAGQSVAEIAKCYTSESKPKVAVLVGKGNNGGGALVAARHLTRNGAKIQVILAKSRNELQPTPAKQLQILSGFSPDTPIHDMSEIHADNLPAMPECDIIIDGLLGYNIHGVPQEPISTLIMIANNAEVPTISVDIPSGLDPDSGKPGAPTVLACATVTLGLPKHGFRNPEAATYLGELFLADIGIPAELVARVIPKFIMPQFPAPIMCLVRRESAVHI